MKPGPRDQKHGIRICGAELRELQRHAGAVAESFGLDRRILAYKGKRAIGLYRWDLECLLDVIELALADKREYPSETSEEYLALARLLARLRHEYEAHYGD
ncbi:hypothetical protein ACFL59_03120 [Planctomycetota bacterium]